MTRRANQPPATSGLGRATDAALVASRALVAVAARSLTELGDLTLPQFRALVVLASRGPQTNSDLAAALGVHPSTMTRMVDRLVTKDYVSRAATGDRREVVLAATDASLAVIDAVSAARRQELAGILDRMSAEGRTRLIAALEEFAEAAGELPDSEWSGVLRPPLPHERPDRR
ncbi:MAG: MarR family transcriptional regulator [Acidimicrobiales bacterium]